MSSPQHEPTMEEILASIRKIISEDNPEAAPAAAQPAPAPPPPPVAAAPAPKPVPVPEPVEEDADAEVLELTQEVVEPQPEPPPAPEPPPMRVEEPTEEIVFEPGAPREPAPADTSGIFSDQTRKAMEDTFDAIPEEPVEPVEPVPARASRAPSAADGASVETVFERAVRESFEPVLEKYLAENSQLVVERMKPLIREWMDENFPALLENAVRGEVERIVRARTRR